MAGVAAALGKPCANVQDSDQVSTPICVRTVEDCRSDEVLLKVIDYTGQLGVYSRRIGM